MTSYLRQTLLAGAHTASAAEFAKSLVAELAKPGVVLTRLWVTDDGGDLRLVASAGSPTGGGTYNRIDGQFARIAAGVGKIGQIAHTRTPLVVRSIRGDEPWLSNPGWIARQGVRAFLGYPLVAKGQVAGVLAIFGRVLPADAELDDLAFLADYAAARLIDLRGRTDVANLSGQASQPARTNAVSSAPETVSKASVIPTRAELREMEKQAIEAALARTAGKIFGPNGAAALLAMKPTTLASRIKALGVR